MEPYLSGALVYTALEAAAARLALRKLVHLDHFLPFWRIPLPNVLVRQQNRRVTPKRRATVDLRIRTFVASRRKSGQVAARSSAVCCRPGLERPGRGRSVRRPE